MSLHRALLRLALAAFAFAALPALAQAPVYGGSESVFVSYADGSGDGARSPSINLGFAGYRGGAISARFQMDTGSVGIIASEDHFRPGRNARNLGPGQQTYSSSGIVENGTWWLDTVYIYDAEGNRMAEAEVPVLLVHSITCLPDARDCRPREAGGREAPRSVSEPVVEAERESLSQRVPGRRGDVIGGFQRQHIGELRGDAAADGEVVALGEQAVDEEGAAADRDGAGGRGAECLVAVGDVGFRRQHSAVAGGEALGGRDGGEGTQRVGAVGIDAEVETRSAALARAGLGHMGIDEADGRQQSEAAHLQLRARLQGRRRLLAVVARRRGLAEEREGAVGAIEVIAVAGRRIDGEIADRIAAIDRDTRGIDAAVAAGVFAHIGVEISQRDTAGEVLGEDP